MLVQIIPFLALFSEPKLIRFSHWMYAKVPHVNYAINGNISNIIDEEIKLYAGTFFIVQDCNPNFDTNDCSFIKGWLQDGTCDSFNGDTYVCNKCAWSFLGTVTTGFLGVFSMFPQMITNLQRSTEQGDFNCQKWLGMVNVLVALFSTLYGLLMFYNDCFRHIVNSLHGQSAELHYGTAYICLIVATLLKPFDLWAHWVVPVSEIHWDPDDDINIKLTCCAYGISSYPSSSSSSSSNAVLLQQNKIVPMDDKNNKDNSEEDIEFQIQTRIDDK